ncbi:MAG: hypothetical protein D6731_03010 [Planctomycetota bacterium]|nr:MAG: hypothetical protein D6731_03010 [Planctomycetota bacterium]
MRARLGVSSAGEGFRLGAGQVLEFVAAGNYDVVYRVRRAGEANARAIEVLGDAAPSEQVRPRLVQEARTLARRSHPGIVRRQDAGAERGLLWFVMVFLAGSNLADLLRRARSPRRAGDRLGGGGALRGAGLRQRPPGLPPRRRAGEGGAPRRRPSGPDRLRPREGPTGGARPDRGGAADRHSARQGSRAAPRSVDRHAPERGPFPGRSPLPVPDRSPPVGYGRPGFLGGARVTALLCGLAASLTLLSPITTLRVGEHVFHRRTLPNGLEALAVDDGQDERVTVFTVYAVGTRAETEEVTGLAHLTEHALFTGTPTTPSGAHDARIEAMGGESNAYTRADYTAYYAHRIPAARLEEVLALEADRMRNLSWRKEDFLHERERLRVEEQHSGNADLQLAARRAYAVWAGRGYGAGVFDEHGNSRGPKLSLAQARAFYDTWYWPRNAAVVVVGPRPGQALDAIERAFAQLPAGPRPPSLEAPALGAGERTLEVPLSRPRLEWVWVGPALGEAEDRLALLLLAELADDLKAEDGAPIEVWQGGRLGPDLFVVGATGSQATREVEKAYAFLRKGEWSDEALARAKKRLRDDFASLPLRARPYFSLAVRVATLVASGHADYAVELPARVDALDRARLIAAARRWLSPERRLVLRYRPTAAAPSGALPDDVPSLRKVAERAEASGDYPRAIAAYEKLLTKRPGRVNTVIYRYQLGALNRRLGHLEEARRQLLAGLKVVEYPALRELLEQVEAQIARGGAPEPDAPSARPESRPSARPESKPSARPESRPSARPTSPSGHRLVGTEGAPPPAWAAEGTEVMGRLEAWRGLPFTRDLVVEFLPERKDGPAGWYEPTTKRLVVTLRGSERFGRGTMLHEMFHALQDQHYDLVRLHEGAKTPEAERALRALIEGEAMLAVQELMNYDFARHAKIPAEGELDVERFEKVFHYGSGLQFIRAVREARGWEGVRAAFAHPPRTTAEVFHPERYLRGWHPARIDEPPPRLPDSVLLESAARGEYGLRLFLSRSPRTRPVAVELGGALRGDLEHRLLTPEGEAHRWWLEFSDARSADRFAAVAPEAVGALPGVRRAEAERHGTRVLLRWLEPNGP